MPELQWNWLGACIKEVKRNVWTDSNISVDRNGAVVRSSLVNISLWPDSISIDHDRTDIRDAFTGIFLPSAEQLLLYLCE